MHADVGDWLVINSHTEARPVRRAAIIGVGRNGEPPYRVRWIDTDHEGLLFPGPDAEVISAATQAAHDALQSERITRLQSAITLRADKR